jgi:hypothetical protein
VDIALLVLLVGAFAILVTAHVALSAALLRRPRPWRGVLALLVPADGAVPRWGRGAPRLALDLAGRARSLRDHALARAALIDGRGR